MRILPRNRWLRRGFYVLLLILLSAGSLFGYGYFMYCQSRAYEDRMLAELKQVDPDWTLEQIVANFPEVPDVKNGSKKIESIFYNFSVTSEDLGHYAVASSSALPYRAKIEEFKLESEKEIEEELIQLRKLVNSPQRKTPILWGYNIRSYGKGFQSSDGTFLSLEPSSLIWDARRQTLLNAPDLSIEDLRAFLIGPQFLSTEGLSTNLFVTRVWELRSVVALEEVLSCSLPSSEVLAKLQIEMEQILEQNPLVDCLRFERAEKFKQMQQKSEECGQVGQWPGNLSKQELRKYLMQLRYPIYAPADRARMLEEMTKLIEQVKSNSPQVRASLTEMEKQMEKIRTRHGMFDVDFFPDIPASKWLSHDWMPPHCAMLRHDLNWKANLRCAITALAAERYRQLKNRWPENWEELVPEYLQEVPEDPWSDKPLRMRKTEEGLTIYSVGANGVDDGGLPEVLKTKLDIGFRLFNPEKRKALTEEKPQKP